MHEREVEDLNEKVSKLVEHHVKLQMRSVVLAIRKTGGKISRLLWVGSAVVLIAGAFAAYIINRNRQAIRVSCLLLSSKILESGGAQVPKGYVPTPAAMAQAEITARLLLRIDQRVLTRADREYIARRQKIIRTSGGVLIPPDCDDVAENPGRIESELKQKKQ